MTAFAAFQNVTNFFPKIEGRSGVYWRHNHVVIMKKERPRDNNKNA